jgi:hypothetical protein
MKFGAQGHCVDHDRLLVRVVVEDHHLQQATGPVCADDEISAVAWDDSCGMVNGVQHVFVADAVLAGAVRDLHLDKVALSASPVKVALSTVIAITVGLRTHDPPATNLKGPAPGAGGYPSITGRGSAIRVRTEFGERNATAMSRALYVYVMREHNRM